MRHKKKLAAFLGVVAGIALFVAPIAAAHTISLQATLGCNGAVSFTVNPIDGGTNSNNDVEVWVGNTKEATGSFVYNSSTHQTSSFSGSFTVPGNPTSLTLTAKVGPWSPDGYNGTPNVSVTINGPENCQVSPTITTSLQPSTITAGSSAFDKATLSGLSNASGGNVAFTVYSSSDCSTGAMSAGSAAVSGSGSVTVSSNAVQFNTPGTYYWKAVFSGDSNNTSVTSPCTAELLTVNQPTTTVTTTTTVPTTTTTTTTVPTTNTVTVTVPSTTTVTVPKTVTVIKKVKTKPFTPPTLPAKISI